MNPPFNQEIAYHYCLELISKIKSGEFSITSFSKQSMERAGQGIMLGSLVCYDLKNKQRVVLYCLSGISKKITKNNKDLTNKKFYLNGTKCIVVKDIVNQNKINRAIKKNDKQIHKLTDKINDLKKEDNKQKVLKLQEKRKILCNQSLKKVYSLYKFTTFSGKKISLNSIIKIKKILPPTGTGDCCEPKLLNYAFSKKLKIVSMAQVYFGGELNDKKEGECYPPCQERCGFILPYILGLDILYHDSNIVVINKPSMLLSVPGRKKNNKDSAALRIKNLYYLECIEQPSVHRLDMETSGLLVFALTKYAHANLSMQFQNQLVQKKYYAVLDGLLDKSKGIQGQIELKFRLDVEHRPYQIYDEINGKNTITQWKKEGTILYTHNDIKKRATLVSFVPLTGRTHQLRLVSSNQNGLNLPIIGDSLYGTCSKGERLLLHASELEFYHPVSGRKMSFKSMPDFI